MTLVTISDHNTLEGALRIRDRPGTFLSVEVTTRFPEDELPLHVLVWDLTEEDHRDLQPLRGSVYALVDFLNTRGLAHALAHPLYRMGPPLTISHVERMMLLFNVWEGRNGARPQQSNVFAASLASAVTLPYLEELADRHGIEPRHRGRISLCAGSDDHGALDIATTWTEVHADRPAPETFLRAVSRGDASISGEHGSSVKLAHAIAALALNAYRASGRALPSAIAEQIESLFDGDFDSDDRHQRIVRATTMVARRLAEEARRGVLTLDALPSVGQRLGALMLAGLLEAPFVGAVRHHADTSVAVAQLEAAFFGFRPRLAEPRALVFTDTFDETNGVAGTMRRLARFARERGRPIAVVTCGRRTETESGRVTFAADWSFPLPTYESLELRVPSLTEVLAYVEDEQPDVIHVATPGPVGLIGLAAAKTLGLPIVGSYHTDLGPYALHLTRDLIVADAIDRYVEWFYRQCSLVLGPTRAVADALAQKKIATRVGVWGRGVDATSFAPLRRDESWRTHLLAGGEVLLLSVGRLSKEKRVGVLLDAFARLDDPRVRLAIAGDGPARAELEADAPAGVIFLGELHGRELATAYASADVFCFPSTTDTFGQVILEAAACGLPILAAAAGGALELVEQGRTGLLVAPDDANELAAALRRLAAAPRERSALGRAARAFALDRTWERSLDELDAAYRTAASGLAGSESQIAA
jgi:glycosyltransferase involved in cell wall biosynthesis